MRLWKVKNKNYSIARVKTAAINKKILKKHGFGKARTEQIHVGQI